MHAQLTDHCGHSRIFIWFLLHEVHKTGKRVKQRSNILVPPSQQHTLCTPRHMWHGAQLDSHITQSQTQATHLQALDCKHHAIHITICREIFGIILFLEARHVPKI